MGLECHAFYEPKSGQSGRFTPHSEVPYAFKPEIMVEAAKAGENILWCDASVFATGARSLDPIFEHIESKGYFLPDSGWKNDKWCNDRSLAHFGFSRDKASLQPHVMGAIYGFRADHPSGKLLLAEHHRRRDLFRGSHDNHNQSESKDPRCLGHRHDQSILSLIAHFYGFEVFAFPNDWIHYGKDPSAILNITSATEVLPC